MRSFGQVLKRVAKEAQLDPLVPSELRQIQAFLLKRQFVADISDTSNYAEYSATQEKGYFNPIVSN